MHLTSTEPSVLKKFINNVEIEIEEVEVEVEEVKVVY